ncbi:40S ribosomal protein S15-like [Rhodamnia argentea]|uniref:40S ribosomal protein S15-like n=1 Tax=Rhodamnia argentea TaxID=178133 RepID=A0ABM3HWQ6_9MYRT|nr:40S ribosomal protein S15-like [Rhodamnia argentea]XP_048141034.1 40S ribosomal protein S15-like [Rhodamnia argentea]
MLSCELGSREVSGGSTWLMALIKKLRKVEREAPPGEKPEPVQTHLRNVTIVPQMIRSVIREYNGQTFNPVEIKPEMIGHCLAEFSISYKPVKHGRPGIGAIHSSRFIPLKRVHGGKFKGHPMSLCFYQNSHES